MSKKKTPLDEFAKLLENPSHDLSVEVYTKNKGRHEPVNKPGPRLTLADLAEKIENLGNDLRNEMNTGFKQVNSRIDNLEKRIDKIDARLDYIVDANNLKDSK